MKTFRSIAASFAFIALFAFAAFAQAPPTGKIGLVNTYAFGSKEGITKFVNAVNGVNTEFKKDTDSLQAQITKFQGLEKELETLRAQSQSSTSKVPINQDTVTAKVTEYENLGREIKFNQEKVKTAYQRRYDAVVGPIWSDIMKAMQDFAKQKGYAVILDGAKLEESGILMGFDDKYDITKEFVAFYNTRPATTAATTAK